MQRAVWVFAFALLGACSVNKGGGMADLASSSPLIQDRPYDSHVPRGYDSSKPTPLVILLHGYGASGFIQEAYFQLTATSDELGFLYATPDGTLDASGKRFWNATDACCNLFGSTVDDFAYLNAIVDDMQAHYNVDPARIYFVGHSNGGFMSHRLACDDASRIAGIVSLAGSTFQDATRCKPAKPVAVLQVHGTADAVVAYNGMPVANTFLGAFPAAEETVRRWATTNGCTGALADSGERLDLDGTLPGSETEVWRATGCAGDGAELWKIVGGSHIPTLMPPDWGRRVINWLFQFKR